MNYQQAIQYLESFINYERWLLSAAERQKFNLDRMRLLLKYLKEPHEKFKSIHVAGSKGKGSTSTMIASILTAAGYKTGLYTSPHLTSFRERMKIDDNPISEPDLADLVYRVKPSIEAFRSESKFGDATFFEIYTALAFQFFAEQKVDFAVIEVGLGGRLDATNAIRPEVSVITPVSFDHMGILGDTIPKIASEKAGIIKPEIPTITSPQTPDAMDVIKSRANEIGSRLIEVGSDIKFRRETNSDLGQDFSLLITEATYSQAGQPSTGDMREYKLRIPLLGYHQIVNAATSVGAIEIINWRHPIPKDATKNGLEKVKLLGRIQVVSQNPTIIVDSAHNVASAKALNQTIVETFSYDKLVLIAAFSSDKEIRKIGFELCPLTEVAILTKASETPRAADPKKVLQQWGDLCHNITVADDLKTALEMSKSTAKESDLICITGSFYIAGEALRLLGHENRG